MWLPHRTIFFNLCENSKKLPNTYVLLDNQSTVDVFYNKDILRVKHTNED